MMFHNVRRNMCLSFTDVQTNIRITNWLNFSLAVSSDRTRWIQIFNLNEKVFSVTFLQDGTFAALIKDWLHRNSI